IDKIVRWCTENKIYVILDMHCAPGGQTGANIDDSWGYPYLYENAESQMLTVQIWKEIANRYKNERYILGYDLLNEPIAPYFDTEKLNKLLEPLYIKITKAIRTVDKNHVVILGGAQWDSNFKIFGKPFDSKLVYTFHKYWSDTTQSVIQDYIDFSNKYNVPIWLGESGENTMRWIASFRRLLDKNDIGWCFWTFKRLDSDRCIVSINQPDNYDKIIEFANTDRQTFDDIRKALPNRDTVSIVVAKYINNIKINNCKVNSEYIKALGLK
ncbi:MAG TPA: cellulase family glycosylhydrolase, partial [Ignavibacteriaceae bacterium]|nr:cellulase family glycosylhydrolase [Ignavibacteriaceae bacterium]